MLHAQVLHPHVNNVTRQNGLSTLLRFGAAPVNVVDMPTPTTPPNRPGKTFRAARQGAGLSVRALADRADINHSTVSRWERGERQISETTYQHLANALADFMANRWTA